VTGTKSEPAVGIVCGLTDLARAAVTFAAQTGNESVIRYLLRKGANVTAGRPDGITLLMLTARAVKAAFPFTKAVESWYPNNKRDWTWDDSGNL
jgi:ankyrin repeat protein